MRAFCAAPLLVALPLLAAPSAPAVRKQVERHRQANEGAIVRELAELVAIPNLASDKANSRRNAERLVEMLTRRGVAARLLEEPDAPPVVYGELRAEGATRTLGFPRTDGSSATVPFIRAAAWKWCTARAGSSPPS